MKKFLTAAVTAGAVVFAVSEASAVQISGQIDFGSLSPITVDTPGNFLTVNFVDFILPASQAVVNFDSGDFTGLAGTVTFSDFPMGVAVPSLWVIDSAPGWKFDLASAANLSVNNVFLNIYGTGTLHAPGFDPTPGVFTLTSQRSNPTQLVFSFSASTSADPTRVPDGGATAMMIGLGLLGLGVLARRK